MLGNGFNNPKKPFGNRWNVSTNQPFAFYFLKVTCKFAVEGRNAVGKALGSIQGVEWW